MAHETDRSLMARVCQQDLAAYRTLMARHLEKCLKVAERMLGNHQDAEDIVQEVCLKVWRQAPTWQGRAEFGTWLYRVLVNACLDHKRKPAPTDVEDIEQTPAPGPAADNTLMAKQAARRVQAALLRLPARQRAAVVLSYYEGMKNQEAADTLTLSLGAFQQLLFRARQNLRDALADDLREEGPHHDG